MRIKLAVEIRVLVSALLAACFAFAFLYLRRGSTLASPQVWSEDGYYIVPQFLTDGWSTMLVPVQGYLISVSRLISNSALTFTPTGYPFMTTLLAWLFTAAIAVFIATAPTLLKGRIWLSLACFLIPADPETFGTPLYSFWWAGLVLLLLPFWERKDRYLLLRLGALLLCGLSSPLIVLISPLMVFRYVALKYRSDLVLLVVTLMCAVVQIWLILSNGKSNGAPEISWTTMRVVVDKFFGLFVVDVGYQLDNVLWLFGLMVIAAISCALWVIRDRWVSISLLYVLLGTVGLSVARVDIEIIHPVFAGPRYFFYPYIILTWILIQGIGQPKAPVFMKGVFLLVLLGALANALGSGWSRTHHNADWSLHVASCLHFQDYAMPVQTSGDRGSVCLKEYSADICGELMGNANVDLAELYPYTIRSDTTSLCDGSPAIPEVEANRFRVVSQDINGSNHQRSAPDGFKPLGSVVTGDADVGSITVLMSKGTNLLFNSGPAGKNQRYYVEGDGHTYAGRLPVCVEWCVLEFSSDLLPAEFTVKLSDQGKGWGEWFAIGVPESRREPIQ